MSKIEVQELSFSYKDNIVIDNLNLVLKKNKINVVLGLNGSGKTTLLRLISKSLTPNKGKIYIDKIDLQWYSTLGLSKEMSVVNQLTKNKNDFLVIDYLLFGFVNRLKFYNKPTKEQVDEIKKKAREIGIDHLLYKNMDCISGGERQMVQICSALIQNTNVIILDEPLSALDLKNQNIVLNLLKRIQDKTIIMTTHNPNICLYLEAFVILLKDGKIVKEGNFNEIIKPEILKYVYGDNIVYVRDTNYDEVTFK